MLLNDHVLKHAYPGFITGKLSDVTGIFIFYLFFLSFLRRLRLTTGVLIAVAFTVWKTSLSSAFLYWFNAHSPIGFHRTVDPTDLWALVMLPVAWWYSGRFMPPRSRVIGERLMLIICPIVFTGQNLPRPAYVERTDTYWVDLTADELSSRLQEDTEAREEGPGSNAYRLWLPNPHHPDFGGTRLSIVIRPFGSRLIVQSLDHTDLCYSFRVSILPTLHCTFKMTGQVRITHPGSE